MQGVETEHPRKSRRHVRQALPLLLLGVTAAACTPVPLLQDAHLLPEGKTRVAVGGAAFVPVNADTYFEPDGPTGGTKHDLRYVPLGHMFGWVRHGMGFAEIQAAFHVPSFAIVLGTKIGLFGNDPEDLFGMALGLDLGASPVLLDLTYGGTLIMTLAPVRDLTIDVSARFGAMSGLWNLPALTVLAGLGIGEKDKLRIGLGYTFDPLGVAAEGFYLGAAWEY